jgi:hypothetical protein
MKKIYSKPEVQVVKLNIDTLLLPISNTEVEKGLSRRARFSDWDFEEEE